MVVALRLRRWAWWSRSVRVSGCLWTQRLCPAPSIQAWIATRGALHRILMGRAVAVCQRSPLTTLRGDFVLLARVVASSHQSPAVLASLVASFLTRRCFSAWAFSWCCCLLLAPLAAFAVSWCLYLPLTPLRPWPSLGAAVFFPRRLRPWPSSGVVAVL